MDRHLVAACNRVESEFEIISFRVDNLFCF